jgi:hypothetical protein
MTNTPIPPIVPPADGDDLVRDDTIAAEDFTDGDQPLDPDMDDDKLDSAAADEQAATEGTLDSDQRT